MLIGRIRVSGEMGSFPLLLSVPIDRIRAYGFLAGREVKDAGVGNIGLEDRKYAQRALHIAMTSLTCFT